MKIAVTGGDGFFGKAAQRAARAAGHQARSFDLARGDDVLGDLSGLGGADVVIHLAGILGTHELFESAEHAIEVNVVGTLRVLQWCHKTGTRFVRVTMPDVFPSVYTLTHVAADRLGTAWHRAYGVPVATVRSYNAYGPEQGYGGHHPRKMIPHWSVAAWRGEPLEIWGDGTQTVDLVHVDDVGRMLVEATRFEDDVLLEAGTGQPLTVNQVAEFVCEVTGSRAGVVHVPMRIGEVPSRVAASGLGWERLDWRPELSLARLAETIRAYREVAVG